MLQRCTQRSMLTIFKHDPHKQFDTKMIRKISNDESCDPIGGFEWLFDYAPSFYIDGNNVEVLQEPAEFYNTLKANIDAAKKRVTLASLYLGTGLLEQDLVSSMNDRLSHAKKISSNFKVSILLDHTRGSRGRSKSSRTMLLPLRQAFPDNVRFAFYHTPQLRGLLRWIVPEKFNETISVSHLKVYLTDDSFIISGANLSHDYFTNRQDRYIHVKNSPNMADYFDDLVSIVSNFSFELQDNNITTMSGAFPAHPYKDWDRGRKFKQSASSVVRDFIHKWTLKSRLHPQGTKGDTLVFPLLQMGPLGITQDEQVTSRIFEDVPEGSRSYLATGYFNLTAGYLDRILSARGRYDVLCAHPMANGFYKAGGIIGGIPDAFTQFAKEFYHRIHNSGQTKRIALHEYLRDRWTFHAKGLWYIPPGEYYPSLTLIGSPNFGHRSLKRDLENQLVLLTNHAGLRQQLRHECDHVYKYGVKVGDRTFESDERRVPLWARIVSGFTRSFF